MQESNKMKFMLKEGKVYFPFYDNDVQAFIPELWANESLMILTENMITAGLVHRDFENVIAQYGDVVNTRRPADMIGKRKTPTDNVTLQDAIATNVQVPLNQHIHTSFLIRDGEESKSFKDLVDEFLKPAIIGQARILDRIVLGQYPQFAGNFAGNLGLGSATTIKTDILQLRTVMNQNKCPMEDRNLIFNPTTEGTALSLDLFLAAYSVGDSGEALKNASLGRKLAFNMWMDQNMASITAAQTAADTVTTARPKGSSTFAITSGAVAPVAGQWLTVAGDDYPQQVASYNSGTKTVTLVGALKRATLITAVVTLYTPGAVNLVAGYAIGWAKEITVDTFTTAPQIGQVVSFNTDPTLYTVVDTNGIVGITLDRPLVNAIANNDTVNQWPIGNYNFAFYKNALALVCRPLAKPKPGVGALSAVVNYDDMSMRVTITYDGNKQGHLVTVDMLCGVAVLDSRMGSLLLE